MADTSFTNGATLTDADWFNDVNRLHYTIFGDPADLPAVKLTLHAAPGAIGGTTPAAGAFTTLAASGLASANLGLTVAGADFNSRGITDSATAKALTLSGSGANSVTIANSATNPTIGTSAGSLAISATVNLADAGKIEWGAGTTWIVGNSAATAIGLVSNSAEQVRINGTASADRYITLTGSNGDNPTIGVSAGELAVSALTRFTNGIIVFGQGSANFVQNNSLMVGALAKASAVSGNSGTLLIRSDDAANRLEAFIQLVTSATAGSRRLSISCVEQGVAAREVDIASAIIFTGQTVGTTVGAAGGASALPATPLGYLTTSINGTACKIPYYTA